MNDEAKRRAAHAALDELPEGGVIGLGTGSTVKFFVDAVADVVRGGRKLTGVCTSEATRRHAAELGIPLLDDAGPWPIEMTVDGADEVAEAPWLALSKGGGGALTREKIVANASKRFVVICDSSKRVARLGATRPIALEVLAFGHRQTMKRLSTFGKPVLREGARTDAGNLLVDLHVEPVANPVALNDALDAIPGIVETGLFLDMTSVVYVAHEDRLERLVASSA
jgi:ribose 5-phosphate isomerase A